MIRDFAIGKAQLLARFARNEFSVDLKVTIRVEFQTETLIIDQKIVKAQIWDTAGQERFAFFLDPLLIFNLVLDLIWFLDDNEFPPLDLM